MTIHGLIDTNTRLKQRLSVLTAGVSIVLIGTAAIAGGAFAVGGVRAIGSAAPARVVPSKDVADDTFDALGPAVASAWSVPFGAVPAFHPISLAAVPAARSSGPTLTFAPQGASLAADVAGPGTTLTEMPRAGHTLVGAAPWTLPTISIAPLSLPSEPVTAGLRLRDDEWNRLAQNPPSTEASAAPDEQAREANLARQLANPVSSLISVPFQQNIQFGIGPANAGWQDLMNVQPVVPFGISEDWNLIARMIMPVVYQNEIFPGAGSQFGVGDTTFQFFLSPKAPTKAALIWGIGPMFFVPSGAYLLSTSTWGAGVDAVALKQVPKPYMGGGVLTYGALVTQLWPVSGSAPINSLFLQPFVSYTLKNSVSFSVQTQATYNWTQSQWTVPLIATVSKVYKFDGQLTSIAFGPKYYIVRPVTAPQWGVQFTVTLLFPKQ